MPAVKFLDLAVRDAAELDALTTAFRRHLDSGRFILGDPVEELERSLSEMHQKNFAIGVNTGTDALVLGIRSLGLEPGDEVITTPFSWIASSTCLLLNNLRPVFVGLGDDLNIDPDSIEAAIGTRTKAVLVVHLHGNMCDMKEICNVATRHGLLVIEDCAQAFGSLDEHGRMAGSYGNVSAFSFNPMKSLAALGDAGAVLTDDRIADQNIRTMRHSGIAAEGDLASSLSYNCRMDSIQASFILERMKHWGRKRQFRSELAALYAATLPEEVSPVPNRPGTRPNHYVFQTKARNRDALRKFLTEKGIETKIRHAFYIYDHPVFFGSRVAVRSPQDVLDEILCLPMHDSLTKEDVGRVVDEVRLFYRGGLSVP